MTQAPTSVRDRTAGDDNGEQPRHRSRLILVLVAVLVLLLAMAATWVVAFSSLLGARTITIRGVHVVSAAQVRAAAKIVPGMPLVRLDTAAVQRRVEGIAEIGAAQVSTSFPSTVVIVVTERVAVGVVRSGSHYELVDKTGDQYRQADSRPKQLPLFVVPNGTDARTTGGAVARVAATLTGALRAEVASIQALDPQAITLLLTDGRVVRWGSAARSADKARILPALLRLPDQQFDVTDPQRPFSR
jgi:cell division protein FtsQ